MARINRLFLPVIFIIVIAPVFLLAIINLNILQDSLIQLIYSRRQTVAYLASTVAQERLDRLVDLGRSLATRVRFRQQIQQGNWSAAIEILNDVPKDFPEIDRLFLTDPDGTLQADIPTAPEVHGQNFAYRDWYKGVTKNWQPFVSPVYQRAAIPSINVIAVAVPIKNDQDEVLGILVLQYTLDIFVHWTSSIDVGENGYAYFVDQKGQVVASPEFVGQNQIIDYSASDSVQKALVGQSGIQTTFNKLAQEERLSAYAPINKYGWATIAQQPTKDAFAKRDQILKFFYLLYGAITVLVSLLTIIILLYLTNNKSNHSTHETFTTKLK